MLRGYLFLHFLEVADGDIVVLFKVLQFAFKRAKPPCNGHGAFDSLFAILDIKLVERQRRQFQFLGSVIAFNHDAGPLSALERLECCMLLLFQLFFEQFAIRGVQVDAGCFRSRVVHPAQTAARGLQDHLLRAVPFLRKHNACQTAAVPSFLSDLDQQDDALLGEFKIKLLKLKLRTLWLDIRLTRAA